MKNSWLSKTFLLTMCIVAPHLFAVEISKDTVLVNNFFPDSFPVMKDIKTDTLVLWNTTNSSISPDSMDIIVQPLKDSTFRYIDFGKIYEGDSHFSAADRITIALYIHKGSIPWVYSDFARYQLNDLHLSDKYLFRMYYNRFYHDPFPADTTFFPSFSFNGPDTCFICGFAIADCFTCVSAPVYLIDFTARVILYYSDGTQVSFYMKNNYSQEVKTRPELKIKSIKKQPVSDIFNVHLRVR